MRVGLNLLHVWPDIGGVWNYVADLVGALGEYDRTNSYITFVNRSSAKLVPRRDNFRARSVALPAGTRFWRVVYENTVLQAQAARDGLDCLHWFAGVQAWWNAVPGAVTVYDAQPLIHPRAFGAAKRVYLRVMMTRTARRAALLLALSDATAASLRTLFGAERIVVVPAVIGDRFVPADRAAVEQFKRRLGLPDRMWLYVAHFYPHKNHVALLQAYQRLRDLAPERWPLILRGDAARQGSDVPGAIKRLGLEADVRVLPPLAPEELPLLYSGATALVYPSLFEGGGIPVAEAMACGCPILASSIPSVRENASDAAVYFDAQAPDAISEAMAAFQSDAELRERARARGIERAQQFRPARVIPRLLEAYRRAAAS